MTTSRRDFLTQTCGAATFLAAHHALLADGPQPNAKSSHSVDARILQLELETAVSLAEMRDFYHGVLQLPVVENQPRRLTLAAGQTMLTFIPVEQAASQPFYHFAFNIPENKATSAWRWQIDRTPLLPIPPRLRDPNYPPEVVNYAHWNAHSIFFFDPAQNVVEYIARHDLQNGTEGHFGPNDILYASEIAFVTDDVPALATRIAESTGVGPFRRGGDENFMALGDDRGLLLVMKRGRVISFDSPEKKSVTVFPTRATWRGQKANVHRLGDQPFELRISGSQHD